MKAKILVEHEIEFDNEICSLDCPQLNDDCCCSLFDVILAYDELNSINYRCPACIEATNNQFRQVTKMVNSTTNKE